MLGIPNKNGCLPRQPPLTNYEKTIYSEITIETGKYYMNPKTLTFFNKKSVALFLIKSTLIQ
jgi:hypothetical protein|tara:strand:+ start:2854 stop:3039 length:186 start_codon:yes stop_codon:yes gene_type:complete